MMVCKRTVNLAAMAAGLLVCNAAWADHVDMRIVRDYPAGTPAIAQIHAWLQQQSRLGTQPGQTPPADAAALGAVRISTAIFDRPLNTRADNISNAAPLPARGQPRDEITIDACNAGQRHRWVYFWEQSGRSAAMAAALLPATDGNRLPSAARAIHGHRHGSRARCDGNW